MTTSLIMTEEFLAATNDRSNPNRKPNTGMIRILLDEYQEDNDLPTISKLETLMIGDASGKEGQHSDSDTKTAERWGCDYLDVEDFIKMMSDEAKK